MSDEEDAKVEKGSCIPDNKRREIVEKMQAPDPWPAPPPPKESPTPAAGDKGTQHTNASSTSSGNQSDTEKK